VRHPFRMKGRQVSSIVAVAGDRERGVGGHAAGGDWWLGIRGWEGE